MKTAATKGPWEAMEVPREHFQTSFNRTGKHVCIIGDGKIVASCGPSDDNDSWKDARFICEAAQELEAIRKRVHEFADVLRSWDAADLAWQLEKEILVGPVVNRP